jgi:molecular chaperone Hsp33
MKGMTLMDRLIKALAFDGQVRLIAIDSKNIVNTALNLHGLSPTATGALGRFLTAGALMGSMLKNDIDKLTLIIKGNGPIGNMVVCSDKNAVVKGYVQNPSADLPLNSLGKLDIGGVVGKNGTLKVIKDIGLKEPYSGSVEIESGEIADEFTRYFAESEQTPSAVALGVCVGNKAEILFAGGYILQLMPGVEDIIIDMIEARIKNIKPITTLLKEKFSLEDILKSISGDDNLVVLEEIEPKFQCDCTRERMEKAINSISEKERREIIEKDGFIEIKCSFCGKKEYWKE